ncbi:hypothetical protein J6590_057231, partial [Homalodisca vitripennis]
SCGDSRTRILLSTIRSSKKRVARSSRVKVGACEPDRDDDVFGDQLESYIQLRSNSDEET